jgi:Novel STAND NTPase 1
VVIDQFEELFTACRDQAERRAFVKALTDAAQGHGHMTVVIVMRSD